MILSFIAALMLQQVFSATDVHLEGGLRAETNAFYRDREKVEDFALYLKPLITLEKLTKSTASSVNFTSDYSKYASNSSLDYFDYNVLAKSELNRSGRWILKPKVMYNLVSEPPDDQGIERLEKTELEGGLELTFKESNVKQHSLRGYVKQTTFNLDALDYGNNQKLGGSYEYQYYFLPETAFIAGFDVESSVYPDGLDNLNADPGVTTYLYDNMLMQARAGIRGRLTEFTNVDLMFGYANRSYKKGTSFDEPVFEVKLSEQITPQDILLAGYIYKIIDSFYTNYELNQHMYIGYSRVFGDRFIVFLRSDYIYSSYSRPNRREDQRLSGTIRVDLSYQPNWIIQAGINADFLISDTLNQTSATVIDPATSYQALQIFVGSKLTF
jgi:hypothetical protein